MRNLIKYLTHQVTATNQHGVHSPFVYNYLTQCLYQQKDFKTSKSLNVLLNSMAYFSIGSIKTISSDPEIENRIHEAVNVRMNQKPPFDMFYFEHPPEELELQSKDIHNDTVLFITNIYLSRSSENAWQHMKEQPIFTVSIDLFHCGLLFFRKEQVKEHFKIRI
ncbi:MAG: hypothetical protein ACFCUL_07575 [Flavobacteriaceae bacterium]